MSEPIKRAREEVQLHRRVTHTDQLWPPCDACTLAAHVDKLAAALEDLEARHEKLLSESERVLPKTEADLDKLLARAQAAEAEVERLRKLYAELGDAVMERAKREGTWVKP